MQKHLNDFNEKFIVYVNRYGAAQFEKYFVYRSLEYFLLGSSISGLFGCFIGSKVHWLLACFGFVAGLFLPTLILYVSNKRDNEKIQKDLKWLYETMTVQLESGLHIGQALQESEAFIKNKRLRQALHQLIEDVVGGEDLGYALDHFEKSFQNQYVISFCMIMEQMKESGYAVKLLDDIRMQMEEMERVQLHRKKESLERQMQVFQILLFLGVLALAMQGCILILVKNVSFM